MKHRVTVEVETEVITEEKEEVLICRRSRAFRRKTDIRKALRKRNICRHAYGFEWYRAAGLHAYSKGKIHCSCPMCSDKTRGKVVKKQGLSERWSVSDTRKIDSLEAQKEDLITDN